VVTVISPLLVELFMKEMQNKNLWYRKTCLRGASQSGEPSQGAGTPTKPRDVEHLTKVRDK
jgi:hypothetical protein